MSQGPAISPPTTFLTARYVPRNADPSSYDKTTWTADAAWHDWDLSTIIPASAVAVALTFTSAISGAGAAVEIKFRRNGNSNTAEILELYAPSGDVGSCFGVVPCDTSRVIEYWITNLGGQYSISAVVMGWFI